MSTQLTITADNHIHLSDRLAAFRERSSAFTGATPEACIANWLDRQAATTRKGYASELKTFAKWLGVETAGEAMQVLCDPPAFGIHADKPEPSRLVLMQYQSERFGDGTGIRSTTVSRGIHALNSCLGALREASVGPGPQRVRRPKNNVPAGTREGPKIQTLGAMTNRLENTNTPAALRDVAIIRLLGQAVLRRSEVLSANLDDLDPDRCMIRVMRKGRVVKDWLPIPEDACRAIHDWLAVRAAIVPKDEAAVFVSLATNGNGGRLDGRSVARIVAKAAKGLTTEVCRPHGLRHCGLTYVAETTGNLLIAQSLAGHGSSSTTARYFNGKKKAARQGTDILNGAF